MNTKWIVTLIIAFIIVLISIVYAFVQTVAAQASQREADAQRVLAEKAREEAQLSRAEAERQHMLFMECQKELDLCRPKAK